MRTLENMLRWTAIIGAFCVPFIVFYVATSMFFPFITGKNFAFRILTEIMAAAWLGLALISPVYRPRSSWILAAFAVFVAVIAIADAQGAYPFKSFWSNYERMDGWVTLIHLLVYMTVSVVILNTERLWRSLLQVSLGVSVCIGMYGILQILGIRAVGQGGVTGLSARIDGTLGNAIYLAVYMLFHVFIAALLWAQEWSERREGKRKFISFAYGGVILLDTVILFFTGTRGTQLGLIGGAIIAALLYIVLNPQAKKVRNYVFVSLTVLVVCAGTLYAARDTQAVKDVGFLVRLANISPYDATIQSRFMNIGMAMQGFKERPILGWGQENYALVFDKYYNPRMYNNEPWFDRVHNSIFDWLVAGGILGLLAYLSIFAATLWSIWRYGAFKLPECVILTGLLVAYFFHNLFVFDNIISYILFATILAYIAWRVGEARNSLRVVEHKFLPSAALPFAMLGSVIIVGSLGWYANAAAISQNKILIGALMDMQRGAYDQSIVDFQSAIALGSVGTQEAREQLIQAASQAASSKISTDLKQRYYAAAGQEMTKQFEASPLDARFPLFLGILHNSYGNYVDSAAALQKASDLSPMKQTIIMQQSENAQARGDQKATLEFAQKAFDILPENINARLFYATMLIRGKQDAAASEVLAPIIATGQAADQRVAQAYAARGMYGKIAELWEGRVSANPEDAQSYFTLASAYYAANNSTKAIATLQMVSRKVPSAAGQAQTFIAQIQSGAIPKGNQ